MRTILARLWGALLTLSATGCALVTQGPNTPIELYDRRSDSASPLLFLSRDYPSIRIDSVGKKHYRLWLPSSRDWDVTVISPYRSTAYRLVSQFESKWVIFDLFAGAPFSHLIDGGSKSWYRLRAPDMVLINPDAPIASRLPGRNPIGMRAESIAILRVAGASEAEPFQFTENLRNAARPIDEYAAGRGPRKLSVGANYATTTFMYSSSDIGSGGFGFHLGSGIGADIGWRFSRSIQLLLRGTYLGMLRPLDQERADWELGLHGRIGLGESWFLVGGAGAASTYGYAPDAIYPVAAFGFGYQDGGFFFDYLFQPRLRSVQTEEFLIHPTVTTLRLGGLFEVW